MNRMKLQHMILTGLFTAMVCVATIAIRIPIPGTNGYIHPGDALVIISGLVLGPVRGAFAAGVGSALADAVGGYIIYVPITLVLKGLVAFLSGMLCPTMRKYIKFQTALPILGGIIDIIIVGSGYYLAEIPLYGANAALLSVPANLVQGAGGLIIAVFLYPVLITVPMVRQLSGEMFHRKMR